MAVKPDIFQSIELPPDYLTYGRQSRGEGGRDDDPDEMHLFESSQSGLPSQFLSLPPQFGQVKGEKEGKGREDERQFNCDSFSQTLFY